MSSAAATATALGLPVSPAWAAAAVSAKSGGGDSIDERAALLAAFLGADLHACGGGPGEACCGARLPADLTVCVGRGRERARGACLARILFFSADPPA